MRDALEFYNAMAALDCAKLARREPHSHSDFSHSA
jgi:hypothetical protein